VNPSEEYHKRLKVCAERVEHYKKLDHLIGNARLGVGLVFFAVVWATIGPGLISGWWVLMPIVAFVILVARHEHVRALGRRAKRSVLFYERGLARIEDRWIGTGDPGRAFFDETHLYAVDLDIFGKGSLFELLSAARTRSGEETLAGWLKAPASASEIEQRQRAIDELRQNIDLREDLAVLGEDVRAAIHPDWLRRWGTAPAVFTSIEARIIAPILSFLILASLVNYFGFDGNGWFVVAACSVGGTFGLHFRKRVREATDAVADPAKDLQILSLLLERLEREQWQCERLRSLRAVFDTEGRSPSKEIRKLVVLIEWLNSRLNPLFAAIAPLLLWATQFAFAIEAWRLRCGPHVSAWLDAAGEFEAFCSIAAYAYEHPQDRFPEVIEDETVFDGEGLRHPLLPAAKCVPNSLTLTRDRQLLIISGSNMSGKSTLLRTVGVNIVLALAGAPVRAKHMRLSILALGATMRVQDSLQAGTSRFYAEIQRLRDIMELTKKRPVLFLLDEILHGTNSHDRAVGAEAVIRGLIAHGAIGLVTTHDLALAVLADKLAPKAANFHFQDHLEDGRMVFDYRLRPGVVEKSNALALMRAIGLEV
jgi:hypothetical protein